jgi:hypothetical protein
MNPNFRQIRQLIWLYLFLWVFEGALRFWLVPALKGPLLLIRDPVVLAIYFLAIQAKVPFMNGFGRAMVVLGVVCFPISMLFGHGSLEVTMFGLRANFLHLPLIFVIARVFGAEDMDKVFRWVMWLSIPMAVLAVRQFQSPQSAPINEGGMHTHYGSVRPCGTFSFVSAMIHFIALVAAVVAARFLEPRAKERWLLVAAAGALMAMILVSGSRTAVVSSAVIGLLAVAMGLSRGAQAGKLLMGVAVLGMVAAFVTNAEFAQSGYNQLGRRFDDAGEGKSVTESTWERFAETTLSPWKNAFDRGIFGAGVGFGTNYGAAVLSGNRFAFLGGEGEWDRILAEMGPFLGAGFILIRLVLVLQMAKLAWQFGVKQGRSIPVLLFGAAWLPVLAGQWGVPSLQGFATISAGLFYASVRHPSRKRVTSRRVYLWSQTETVSPVAGTS